MNCKQGDLAIVVRSYMGINLGKIVRCVRWIGRSVIDPATGLRWGDGPSDDNWEIDPPLVSVEDGGINECQTTIFRDSDLRPLRGDLLDNETETGREIVRVEAA